jgi:hypothetical protein
MKSVLYIFSKSAQSWPDYKFVLNPGQNSGHKTVVLIEKGVVEEGLSADQIFKVNEDPVVNTTGTVGNAHPTPVSISYRELLDLIFASDNSVVV